MQATLLRITLLLITLLFITLLLITLLLITLLLGWNAGMTVHRPLYCWYYFIQNHFTAPALRPSPGTRA